MRRPAKPVTSILVALVIIIGLVIGFHSAIHKQLNDWKVLPEPEKLTELYFTHPNSLPTTYVPGQAQTVAFTVHNLEYQNEDYKYKITETSQDGSRTQTLASGNFGLSQNKYKQCSVNINTVNFGQRVKLEVALTNVNEEVDYWLTGSGS